MMYVIVIMLVLMLTGCRCDAPIARPDHRDTKKASTNDAQIEVYKDQITETAMGEAKRPLPDMRHQHRSDRARRNRMAGPRYVPSPHWRHQKPDTLNL